MKRKLIVFGISLLMMIGSIIPTSSAQDFQVTPLQLKQTNILFNHLEELEIQDSLNTVLITFYKELISDLEYKDSLNQYKVVELNSQINRMTVSINNLENSNKKVTKQRNIVAYWAGGSTGLCLILLTILLL